MKVLLLTVFLSTVLAAFFIVLFLRDRTQKHRSSPEQDALLPFADEASRPPTPKEKSPSNT